METVIVTQRPDRCVTKKALPRAVESSVDAGEFRFAPPYPEAKARPRLTHPAIVRRTREFMWNTPFLTIESRR